MADIKIFWTELAAADLDQIEQFISRDNPNAALQQVIRIIEVVETRIGHLPRMGKPGRIEGTREQVVSNIPYIIIYRFRQEMVEILRILHAARQWPQSPIPDKE